MSERWIRSPRAAVVEHDDRVLLVGTDATVRALDGDTAELARAVIAFMAMPRSRDEILAHVESLSGPLGERATIVDELIALLRTSAAIHSHVEASPRAPGLNVVVGISGALAATHAPLLLRAIQQAGHTIEVALTQTAQRFVAVDALTAILQRPVHTSMWPAAAHDPVPHVALAEWADLVVIYPASATTIARIAHGDYSDLVAALASCTRAPVIVAPSMNAAMHDSPAVMRNVETLRRDGRFLVGGVPSAEVADAPALRGHGAVAAPSPAEVVRTIEALRAAGVLLRPRARAVTASDWDAIYRAARVPWASETCDPDIAAALSRIAQAPSRVLDVGTGLGQVARYASDLGHTVVATDLSEVALALASRMPCSGHVVWLRDDVCATQLASSFDLVIDRATLHTLPDARTAGWFASMQRLVRVGGHLIVKAHRDGVRGITNGWPAAALAARLPGFELISSTDSELPGIQNAEPLPAVLMVFRRL